MKEDFGRSMVRLKQVQAKLTQEENSDYAQRAETLMSEMEQLRRAMIEIKADGRVHQDKLESSIARQSTI